MSQVINTNIPSLNAQRNLDRSQSALQVSLNRLSSGLRINSAKDDAAGLAITERFTAQINGLNQAYRNANDGISLAQTAEGDLQQVTNNLQRIRVLIVQAANATNSSSDKGSLMHEINDLKEEITRIGNVSKFNGVALLNGSFTQQVFQVGANQTSFDTITVDLSINVVDGLQLQTVDFSSGASNSTIRGILSTVDSAINTVSATRSELGSLQLRFESVVASLRITTENLTASRSRILDADFAQETANMTRNQILQQAGTAMLAQANALPNNVLSLLR